MVGATRQLRFGEIEKPGPWQDIGVGFESLDTDQIRLAARDAGGFWISGVGMQPPASGGDGLSRIDLVLTAHGPRGFGDEYAGGVEREIEGVVVLILPLDRVLASPCL